MVKIRSGNFSISQICRSGQCFRMAERGEAADGIYSLVAAGRYLELRQEGDEILFDCPQADFDEVWKKYFDLETDYARIIASIDEEDVYLVSAAGFGSGIRILRQDLWEMIISFIISQQNNIRRIRRCIDLLCRQYGERKQTGKGVVYYGFPTPETLAGAEMEDLCACNLGYRSRYVHETAVSIRNGEVDLEALHGMDYPSARAELMKLCGVGAKVADCICLFALHKTEAFPVDTHIHQVLEARYPGGFSFEKYGQYVGVLQQYMFYYDLFGKKDIS